RIPSRSKEAQSHVTIASGSDGDRSGGTSRSSPVRKSARRGSRCGWFGYAHVTPVPRSRRWCASPNIEPSASASGFTWHAIATWSAPRSTSAARLRSSGVTARLPIVQLLEDVVDPLRGRRRLVLLEAELRDD